MELPLPRRPGDSFELVNVALKFNLQPPIPRGVTHGDELIYLFSTGVFNLTPEDWEVARIMSNLWANFVIYGYDSC